MMIRLGWASEHVRLVPRTMEPPLLYHIEIAQEDTILQG